MLTSVSENTNSQWRDIADIWRLATNRYCSALIHINPTQSHAIMGGNQDVTHLPLILYFCQRPLLPTSDQQESRWNQVVCADDILAMLAKDPAQAETPDEIGRHQARQVDRRFRCRMKRQGVASADERPDDQEVFVIFDLLGTKWDQNADDRQGNDICKITDTRQDTTTPGQTSRQTIYHAGWNKQQVRMRGHHGHHGFHGYIDDRQGNDIGFQIPDKIRWDKQTDDLRLRMKQAASADEKRPDDQEANVSRVTFLAAPSKVKLTQI